MTYITIFDKTAHFVVNAFSINFQTDDPARHVGEGQDWTFGAWDRGRYFMVYDEENDVWVGEPKSPEALAAGRYSEPPSAPVNIWTEAAINHAAGALILSVYPAGKQNTIEKFGPDEARAEMWNYIRAVIDVTHGDVGKPWSETVWPDTPTSRIKSSATENPLA